LGAALERTREHGHREGLVPLRGGLVGDRRRLVGRRWSRVAAGARVGRRRAPARRGEQCHREQGNRGPAPGEEAAGGVGGGSVLVHSCLRLSSEDESLAAAAPWGGRARTVPRPRTGYVVEGLWSVGL